MAWSAASGARPPEFRSRGRGRNRWRRGRRYRPRRRAPRQNTPSARRASMARGGARAPRGSRGWRCGKRLNPADRDRRWCPAASPHPRPCARAARSGRATTRTPPSRSARRVRRSVSGPPRRRTTRAGGSSRRCRSRAPAAPRRPRPRRPRPRTAAGHAREIPRVGRRMEGGVLGRRTHREFVHVEPPQRTAPASRSRRVTVAS